MKFVALISGGKDSFYNILHCIANGHELVAIANLHPKDPKVDELNSFMFQTVGHDVIEFYPKCLDGIPLYRRAISGSSTNVQLEYSPTEDDEIEDLLELLKTVLEGNPEVQAVSCGAILSHYQRTRVENVCDRLGLTSLAYLWQRNQENLMSEMCALGLEARLIKVAAIGLDEQHLGLLLQEVLPTLKKLKNMYDVHVCGEGGEFESLVLDAPIFSKKLQISEREYCSDSSDTLYLRVKVEVVEKEDVPNFNHPQIPEILDHEFTEIIADLDVNGDIAETSVPYRQQSEQSQFPIRISQTATKLFVSNVTSSSDSVELQTREILSRIRNLLTQNNRTLYDVQHMTVLVKDMKDFAKVNGVYSSFFSEKYLPPSRVCVETSLPTNVLLQMSCVVLKEGSLRLGIHIRSRSYWAPQNIGPYSQAIVETLDNCKSASLSGQIPLIPASMELSSTLSLAYDTALALQHLYRVMEVVNVKNLSSCLCYITNPASKNIVSEIWASFLENMNMSHDYLKKLLIVRTSALPRGASVEWGGFAFEPIEVYDDEDSDEEPTNTPETAIVTPNLLDNGAVTTVVGSSKVLVFSGDDVSQLGEFMNNEVVKKSQLSVMTTLENISSLIHKGFSAEWIPVLSVWDYNGTDLVYGAIWER